MKFKHVILIVCAAFAGLVSGCGNEGKILAAKESNPEIAKAERTLVGLGCFFKYEETTGESVITTVKSLDCAEGAATGEEVTEMRKAIKNFILQVYKAYNTTNELDLAGLMKQKVIAAKAEYLRLSQGNGPQPIPIPTPIPTPAGN